MHYALMIYGEPGAQDALSEADQATIFAEFRALAADPQFRAATQLQPVETASTLRVVAGRTLVTDGPFADTKEVLGGVVVVEAANLDEALDVAARIPTARFGGAVEVRPVVPR